MSKSFGPIISPALASALTTSTSPKGTLIHQAQSRMGMGQRNSQGIGSIRLRCGRQTQHGGHHVLHLSLVGSTGTGDRLLDLAWTVFTDREAMIGGTDDGSATRLAKLEGGRGIVRHEHLFNGEFSRPVHSNKFADTGIALRQSLRQVIVF